MLGENLAHVLSSGNGAVNPSDPLGGVGGSEERE